MDEDKEKREKPEDSLMWNEEDYDSIQKITGFDDESVEEDQKKGVNLVVFIIICIISLLVGIFIGYNIHKKNPNQPQLYTEGPTIILPTVVSAYTKMNEAGELYLYIINSINEEFSILQLNDLKYYYEIESNLYVLVDKDGLSLYEYSFDNNGYHRELMTTLNDRYEAFNYKNGLILIKRDNYVRFYNKNGVLVREVETALDSVLDYNNEYMIYQVGNNLNIYYFASNEIKTISNDNNKYFLLDDNKIFYLEDDKIERYDILDDNIVEITKAPANSFFIKIEDYYLYNSGKSLYILDNSIRKIEEFKKDINEYAYLDQNNVILILDDYNSTDCAFLQKEYGVLELVSKNVVMKKITGCLKTKVINDLITIK